MNLPPEGRQYEAYFEASAHEFVLAPALLAAVCEDESRFGDALEPKGPEGTGDFKPRHRSRAGNTPVKPYLNSVDLVVPLDGLGWGRGLMQLDWMSHEMFWSSDVWKSAAWNIHMGALELSKHIAKFGGDEYLGLLAYNEGENFVRHCIDRVTVSDGEQLHHLVSRYCPHDGEGRDYAERVFVLRDRIIQGGDKAGSSPAPSCTDATQTKES